LRLYQRSWWDETAYCEPRWLRMYSCGPRTEQMTAGVELAPAAACQFAVSSPFGGIGAPAPPPGESAFSILRGIAYAKPPNAIVTKLGARQSRLTHSSASEASQISSRVSIASPTGRSCLTKQDSRAALALCELPEMCRHGFEIMGNQNPSFLCGERQCGVC
jgi:hypothetical protein